MLPARNTANYPPQDERVIIPSMINVKSDTTRVGKAKQYTHFTQELPQELPLGVTFPRSYLWELPSWSYHLVKYAYAQPEQPGDTIATRNGREGREGVPVVKDRDQHKLERDRPIGSLTRLCIPSQPGIGVFRRVFASFCLCQLVGEASV